MNLIETIDKMNAKDELIEQIKNKVSSLIVESYNSQPWDMLEQQTVIISQRITEDYNDMVERWLAEIELDS